MRTGRGGPRCRRIQGSTRVCKLARVCMRADVHVLIETIKYFNKTALSVRSYAEGSSISLLRKVQSHADRYMYNTHHFATVTPPEHLALRACVEYGGLAVAPTN